MASMGARGLNKAPQAKRRARSNIPTMIREVTIQAAIPNNLGHHPKSSSEELMPKELMTTIALCINV